MSISAVTGRIIIYGVLFERKLMGNETTVAAQMQEMELVRQKVYELERNQMQIKQRYAPGQ